MLALLATLAAAAHPPSAHAPAPAAPAAPAAEGPAAGNSVPRLAEADPSPPLEPAAPWWETITVTVDDQGRQQSCRYETNLKRPEACDQAIAASIKTSGKNRAGVYSKVTFERRFNPGGRPDAAPMKPGDILLGRQVMYLTIDASGAISSCKLVSSLGDVPPDYGCAEARKEQFRAEPGAGEPAARQAFLTVSAYGHTEVAA